MLAEPPLQETSAPLVNDIVPHRRLGRPRRPPAPTVPTPPEPDPPRRRGRPRKTIRPE